MLLGDDLAQVLEAESQCFRRIDREERVSRLVCHKRAQYFLHPNVCQQQHKINTEPEYKGSSMISFPAAEPLRDSTMPWLMESSVYVIDGPCKQVVRRVYYC